MRGSKEKLAKKSAKKIIRKIHKSPTINCSESISFFRANKNINYWKGKEVPNKVEIVNQPTANWKHKIEMNVRIYYYHKFIFFTHRHA